MKTSNYILMLGITCFLMVLSSCEPLFVPTVEEGKTGTTNGYEWVDLGLPSGVKWATCNMGASSPQESGKEYAWEMFNVRSSWGDKWRMPKGKEFEELEEYCKIVPTMFMGMKGVDCKGPNGNHIFIPLPDGEWSRYWTISLSKDGASAGNVRFYEEGGLFPWFAQSIVDGKCFIRPVLMETKIFSVSYNANGGSGYMKSQMFYDGIEQMLQANAFTREGFVLMGWNTKADGSGTSYKNGQVVSISQNVTLYAQWFKTECVDLGLSVKWADCNVGATTPEGYGDYFAWGETKSKSYYDWDTYKYGYNPQKYNNVDGRTELLMEDDAAHVNWGGKWRMPTLDEQQELVNNCTWTWTKINGINGCKVTSRINGNSIFLPAAGCRYGASVYNVGSSGYYWSSSLYESNPNCAYYLYFSSGTVDWRSNDRYYGLTVRAVCP